MGQHWNHNPSADARLGRAWLALCLALVLHVADEAATGFLSVYNPTVTELRRTAPWLPLPTFTFDIWLAGLIAIIVLLLFLAPAAFRGARWIRPISYAIVVIMVVNAACHTIATVFGRTIASIRFSGPMPGFYSSPLLLAASIYLLFALRTSVTIRNNAKIYKRPAG